MAYDFESGLPTGWSVGGGAGWVVDGSRTHGGSTAAHSGAIGNNQLSTMTATFAASTDAEVLFWFYTSSEKYDFLEVRVDGTTVGGWSSENAWTPVAFRLGGPGTHIVEWRYEKDYAAIGGADRVWIDDVVVRPAMAGEGFEGASLPTEYSTSGGASWTVSSSSAHGGSQSARSGSIGHGQTTSLSRSVTLARPGSVRFWFRVSTEETFDELELYVDGVLQGSWSGDVSWSQMGYALAEGTHALEWRYTKDGSASSGSDAVWIDDVVIDDTDPTCAPPP